MKKACWLPIIIVLCAFAYTFWHQHHPTSSLDDFVPAVPDYADSTMWYTVFNDSTATGADIFYIVSTWEFDWTAPDGRISHYADVYRPDHRNDMGKEAGWVAAYMADGNDFYAPYYRHITLDSWATCNEDTIRRRATIAMDDVRHAFDTFQRRRDRSRPFVIAGFSQGGLAVVQLLKYMDDDTYRQLVAAYVLGYKVMPSDTAACHRIRAAQDSTDIGVTICYNSVKDVRYIQPLVADSCVMCINPVNWRTDATPAIIADTITVTLDTIHHVLVLDNYAATEYPPILGIINVGDIHGCEPWLYSECLRRNIKLRIQRWRQREKGEGGMMNDE